MDTISVVDQGTGFEIHVDPHVVAETLHRAGWTVLPPVTAEEALSLMGVAEILGERTEVVEGWHGHTQKSWMGADQSRSLVPEPVTDRHGRHRTGDHATSVAGARSVAFRAGSQLHRLLHGYAMAASADIYGGPNRGWTDEHVAEFTGLLRSCFWKRCGELRADGLIETIPGPGPDGVLTCPGSAGVPRIVCRITEAGTARLARLDAAT
jgi:hypothetical protein